MLVLRRREGDSILIGDELEICVLEISPTRVKLGVLAPGSVPIVRKEVKETRDVNLTAASFDPGDLKSLLRRIGGAVSGG